MQGPATPIFRAAGSSETLLHFYWTAEFHIPEDGNLPNQHYRSKKSLKAFSVHNFELFDWNRFRNARDTTMQ
jgi:hypothetical protein